MSKTQTTLNRSEMHLVRTIRTKKHVQSCPDCRQDVSHSKGAQKINGVITHGWNCDRCNNVMPCNTGPDGQGFVDGWTGLKMQFRDGSEHWVPVPERYARADQ